MEEFYVISGWVVALSIILMWYAKSRGTNGALPPGPRGLPIVGYMPFMSKNLVLQLTQLGHKYGPIYKFYLGSKPCVVVSSPSLVKEVLRDKDAVFCDRDVTVAAHVVTFGGNGIAWAHPDDKWRAMRKVFVQELMSGKRLDASYGLRRDVVRKAVRDVHAAGKPVDIGVLAFRTTISLVMNMVWGGTVDGEEGARITEEFRVLVSKVIDLMGEGNVSDFFPALAWFDLQGVKKRTEGYMASLERILDAVISKKRETKNDDEGKKDFLQILLELTDRSLNSDTVISLPNLKSTVMDTVGGGTDTSSSTMEWAMAELINNPREMGKVQKELSDVVGLSNMVEESHIPKLKYLEAVIKETLRLHPVGPLLVPRTPSQPNSTAGGYSIPNNSKIFINVWSLHRDPSLWENPTEFRPDRFLQPTNEFQFQYIPFGSGRRVCPGKPLADRMAVFFLGSLLHSFDWRVAPGDKLDMAESFRIVLRKSTPLLLLPKPRLPNSDLYL